MGLKEEYSWPYRADGAGLTALLNDLLELFPQAGNKTHSHRHG